MCLALCFSLFPSGIFFFFFLFGFYPCLWLCATMLDTLLLSAAVVLCERGGEGPLSGLLQWSHSLNLPGEVWKVGCSCVRIFLSETIAFRTTRVGSRTECSMGCCVPVAVSHS